MLIAGDFNFDRRSALHQLLCTGSSAYGESVPLVRAGSAPYQSPLLPLRDAYRDGSPPGGPQLRASFRNGRVLDFVWHSAALPPPDARLRRGGLAAAQGDAVRDAPVQPLA